MRDIYSVSQMKKFLLLLCIAVSFVINAQEGYPVPPDGAGRLFYIQHSNSQNTYVYDANMKSGKLDADNPVDVYRILYTEGGVKAELTKLQAKLAYGVKLIKATATLCQFTLAAYPDKILWLRLNSQGIPYVTVTVNGKDIFLSKLFLMTNKTGMDVKYIDFYGIDAATGKEVQERMYL